MQIKMKNMDWESLMVVTQSFKAKEMLISHVVYLEKMGDLIVDKLGKYLKEKTFLLDSGKEMVKKAQAKMQKLFEAHPDQQNHPEVVAYADEINEKLRLEINDKIAILDNEETELDIPDNWYQSLRLNYIKQVSFGDNGYLDNHLGRAAFVRTLKALEIPVEEVEIMDKEKAK